MMAASGTRARHDYARQGGRGVAILPADTDMKGTWKIVDHAHRETGKRTIMEASHKLLVLKLFYDQMLPYRT